MSKLLFVFLSFSLSLFAIDGGKEGHGGDPLIIDFHHRAEFFLSHLRRNRPLLWEEIDIFAKGVKELVVNVTDASLPSVGRVLEDPQRPGKFFVLLDQKKYSDAIEKRNSFDLGAFVAHEVFETQGLDYDYKISKKLHFPEETYKQWRDRYVYKSPSPNSFDRYGAIVYSYETGKFGASWEHLTASDAEAAAMAKCGKSDCYSVSWVRNGCLALAVSKTNFSRTAWYFSVSRKESEALALKKCENESAGESCKMIQSVCTSYAKP